jgi:hypothetical protein
MAYTQLKNLPIESSIYAKSLEESIRIKKEKEAKEAKVREPLVNKYNEIRKIIEDTEKLKKLVSTAVGKAMADNRNKITFFPSAHSSLDGYISRNDYRVSLNSTEARDIFTTTKYGDVVLVDLLKEKLGDEFQVSASTWGSFELEVTWKPVGQKECIII